jgi:hypothetical protein
MTPFQLQSLDDERLVCQDMEVGGRGLIERIHLD